MRREILCLPCAKKLERDHKVYGVAFCSFRCDQCNEALHRGFTCCAASDGDGAGAIKWEHDYIQVDGGKP